MGVLRINCIITLIIIIISVCRIFQTLLLNLRALKQLSRKPNVSAQCMQTHTHMCAYTKYCECVCVCAVIQMRLEWRIVIDVGVECLKNTNSSVKKKKSRGEKKKKKKKKK